MEEAVESLEKQMKKTDERLDDLALQVGNIENEIFSEDGAKIEVNNLLRSVNQVKNNYQNLRQELLEVQNLQKQLSTSLQFQLKMMHTKFNILKEKINVSVPQQIAAATTSSVPNQQQQMTRSKSPGNSLE